MKKILFALVAISLVLVSCKKEEEKKQEEVKAPTINLAINGQPTAASAAVTCDPSDATIGYFVSSFPAEYKSQYDAKTIAESLYGQIEEYGYEIADVCYFGHESVEVSCQPQTDYTAFAIYLDAKETVYDLFTVDFTGGVLPTSSTTITIAYDNDTTVTYTQNGSDPFMAWILDDASAQEMCAQMGVTELDESVAIYVLEGYWYVYNSYYGYDFRFTESATEYITDYFEEVTPGMAFHVMAAPMYDGGYVNGAVAIESFTTPGVGSARRANVAPSKAAKFEAARASIKLQPRH